MDQALLDASGSNVSLDLLRAKIQADPLFLEGFALLPSVETPLHIASRAGDTSFVQELLNLNSHLAREMIRPNQDGLNPLHIAAGLGHVDIVEVLLTLGSDLCLLTDKEGRAPLHYAVMRGKVEVLKKLLCSCSKVLEKVTKKGETVFHLAVKHKQPEALEVLLERVISDKKAWLLYTEDKDGLTIYQLAHKTTDEPLYTKDKDGLTIYRLADEQIFKLLKENSAPLMQAFAIYLLRKVSHKLRKLFSYNENAMLVVAILIATVTYQAVLEPPATIWKENKEEAPSTTWKEERISEAERNNFMWFNTSGFVCSLLVLLFFKATVFARILMAMSLVSVIISYSILVYAMCPLMISLGIAVGPVFVLGTVLMNIYTGYVISHLARNLKQKTSLPSTITTESEKKASHKVCVC